MITVLRFERRMERSGRRRRRRRRPATAPLYGTETESRVIDMVSISLVATAEQSTEREEKTCS